jgi:cell fate regulator YaaT (PSP1 superfamily)
MIAIRLRDFGQVYFYAGSDVVGKAGDYVILEHDRGMDYGAIIPSVKELTQREHKELLKRVIRQASPEDLKQIEENRKKAKDAFTTCLKKIEEHKLEMKLVEAEYSFDRSKIIFYFTAEGRVDFRNLVKDLAKIFKARIELRQIGPRDEAKLFGGYGPCGRELCCVKFLKDFEPVTVKMVKEEGLPLNRPKVSGICDRLMCCLSFEYETYKMLSVGLPREGERIHTPGGKGKVTSVNVFKRTASVELEDGSQIEMTYK